MVYTVAVLLVPCFSPSRPYASRDEDNVSASSVSFHGVYDWLVREIRSLTSSCERRSPVVALCRSFVELLAKLGSRKVRQRNVHNAGLMPNAGTLGLLFNATRTLRIPLYSNQASVCMCYAFWEVEPI